MHDVYFIIRMSMYGFIGYTQPKQPKSVLMEALVENHCYGTTREYKTYIILCDIKRLETLAIVVIVVWILGAHGPLEVFGW